MACGLLTRMYIQADNNIINTAIRYGFVANPWMWSVSASCEARCRHTKFIHWQVRFICP